VYNAPNTTSGAQRATRRSLTAASMGRSSRTRASGAELWHLLRPYLLSAAITSIATAAAWLLQTIEMDQSITPLYLLGVLVCATTTGRGPAIFCAVLSFLLYKLLFVPPVFTLSITDSEDGLRLGIFIIIAVIGGGLAVRVREQALAARRLADETTVLYDLSQAISTHLEFDRIAPMIVETAVRILPAQACSLHLSGPCGALDEIARAGDWSNGAAVAEAEMLAGTQPIGVIRVALLPPAQGLDADQQRLLDTLAGQSALVVERGRLAQAAAHAEALAESDRLKSTLLSAVSHDFRTPLAAITAAADELVAEDVRWSDDARRGFSSLIRTEAERLNQLVMNLLDLTRLEAGVLRPRRGWYNIAEIVGAVLQRSVADLGERRVDVSVPDDLPLAPVDYVQLEQVVWNLLQNAIKYAPGDGLITIRAATTSQSLVLFVGDRGPGIPEAERERVFEKFYRVQSPDLARVPGAGIGLAICRGLIEAHAGTIQIAENPGGGTLVQIELPLAIDDLQEQVNA
jgi:two-component system, OmpR family, sensor histidine kinase KdpD